MDRDFIKESLPLIKQLVTGKMFFIIFLCGYATFKKLPRQIIYTTN